MNKIYLKPAMSFWALTMQDSLLSSSSFVENVDHSSNISELDNPCDFTW